MTTRAGSVRRGARAALCAVALLAVGSGIALANALPTRITPGDGAVLTTRPPEVSVDTAEEMSGKAGDNDLIVRDAAGAAVTPEHAMVSASRTHMSLPLPAALPVGTYTAQWFTVSGHDGHAASGQWKFTYDPSKPAVAGSQPGAAAAHVDDPARADGAASPAGTGPLVPLGAAAAVVALVGAGVLVARRRG